MKNRIPEDAKKKPEDKLRTFFLACEFKPNARLFSVLDPFAYDIKPAFIHGSLGMLSYKPNSYAIIDTDENSSILLGYLVTITEPDTVLLLDKIKGAYGEEAYNTHERKVVQAFTDVDKVQPAWAYVLSEFVLEGYEQIEQVEFGLWDEDDMKQVDFLEKIGDSL